MVTGEGSVQGAMEEKCAAVLGTGARGWEEGRPGEMKDGAQGGLSLCGIRGAWGRG